jgi:glycerol uptake facilitator-like aquaporin
MLNYLAEFLGTAAFFYVILATGNPLLIGFTLFIVILLIQKLSGGMVNSTLTVILAIAGKVPVYEVLPYIIVQFLGGLTALEIYKRWKIPNTILSKLEIKL